MPTTAKPTPSWRSILPTHPAAEFFPLMPPDELRALGEDIRKHGLRVPCCLIEDEDGRVVLIDGRNRLDALELIGEKITAGVIDNSNVFERVEAAYVDVVERVISLNIHRRHLTAEQRRDLIAKLIKAQPEKSDRQIAETAKVGHPTVARVRKKLEAKGDVERRSTRTDTKGREQPARKPTMQPAGRARHVCWQCKQSGKLGEVEQHAFEAYPEIDVWLHPACVAAFRLSEEEKRDPIVARDDDVGPDSRAEAERLRVCVKELQDEKRCLEMKVAGLEREVEELRGKLATVTAGDMSISEFQAAHKQWEETFEAQRGIIARLESELASLRAGAAAPLHPLDIPGFLDRTKQRAAP